MDSHRQDRPKGQLPGSKLRKPFGQGSGGQQGNHPGRGLLRPRKLSGVDDSALSSQKLQSPSDYDINSLDESARTVLGEGVPSGVRGSSAPPSKRPSQQVPSSPPSSSPPAGRKPGNVPGQVSLKRPSQSLMSPPGRPTAKEMPSSPMPERKPTPMPEVRTPQQRQVSPPMPSPSVPDQRSSPKTGRPGPSDVPLQRPQMPGGVKPPANRRPFANMPSLDDDDQFMHQSSKPPKSRGYSDYDSSGMQKNPQVSSLKRPPKAEMEDESKRRKAQLYDWGKTSKFSADQKKFLERVFNQFADNVTTKMAPLLQTRISLEFQSAKLRSYSSFIQGLYEPITMIVTRMDPEFQGLIVIDYPLSFALIDRCLGGKGEPLDEMRFYTEIETAIFERVTNRLIESYQEAWSEIRECKPQFVEMEFNPQTVHIAKSSDMMVCVSFDVRLAHSQGPIYVALPFDYLKSVLPKANFEEFMLTRSSQTQATPTVAPLFAKNLEAAKVPVSVDLGFTELAFQELLVLEPGDFIKLDQEITKPLRIRVNEKVKFLGRPGIRDNKVSVQVTKVLQEGDEEFEE